MDNDFANKVSPTILYVLRVLDQIRSQGTQPKPGEIRPRIKNLLSTVGGTPELDLARYALVAWIDEVLVFSPWPFSPQWSNNFLEVEYYGPPGLRAKKFFEKALEANRRNSNNALETYLLCITLGFKGIYRDGVVAQMRPESKNTPTQQSTPTPSEPPMTPSNTMLDAFGGGKNGMGSDSSIEHSTQVDSDFLASRSGVHPPQMQQEGSIPNDFPKSLEDWAENVYKQTKPRPMAFSPARSPAPAGDCRPLSGRDSFSQALPVFVVIGAIFLGSFLLWLIWG